MSFVAICGRAGSASRHATEIIRSPAEIFGHATSVVASKDDSFCVVARPAQFARSSRYLLIGDARLENRDAISSAAALRDLSDSTDLDILAQALDTVGVSVFRRALGEFAVIAAALDSGHVTVARDSLGLGRLYRTSAGVDTVVFSPNLKTLADLYGCEFDDTWIAGFMLRQHDELPSRTVWKGIEAVLPGTVLHLRHGRLRSVERCWSPFRPFEPFRGTIQEAGEEIRHLLLEGVRRNLHDEPGAWCLLSGGLDSSSVVAAADHLRNSGVVRHGISGTVTYASTSNPLLERTAVGILRRDDRSSLFFENYWYCQGGTAGGRPTTCPDLPWPWFGMWALDEEICEALEGSGCRSLHTGIGSDVCFSCGNSGFIRGLMDAREFRAAAKETLHQATATRECFWPLLGRQLASALAPNRVVSLRQSMPPWLRSGFLRRSELRGALREIPESTGELRPFQLGRAKAIRGRSIPLLLEPYMGRFSIRHPFLFRPLVEFALSLAPRQLRDTQYSGDKAVLRHAMTGILPELLRTKAPSLPIDHRILLGLAREGPFIDRLLSDPIVAQRGWVNGRKLREAVSEATRGESYNPALWCTLSLEAWLRLREDRWPTPAKEVT